MANTSHKAKGSFLRAWLAGALLVTGGCAAQQAATAATSPPAPQFPLWPARLNVHPETMATGTHTRQAGLQPIGKPTSRNDSLNAAWVYVPPQGVGTRRMPLIVLLHGFGMTGLDMLNVDDDILQRLADEYGVILLAPKSTVDYRGWDWGSTLPEDTTAIPDVQRVDAAMRYVLGHYAIDPARIALGGTSTGASFALFLGLVNGDVFSRLLVFAPAGVQPMSLDAVPRRGTPALFIGQGTHDLMNPIATIRTLVQWLRHTGDPATYVEDPGQHELTQERATAGMRWLAASWR